jgi:hypothetical protein
MKSLIGFIAILLMTCTVNRAAAQTIDVSCPKFFADRHQAISCVEALFSQDNYHFTLASLPPSNGFGPGLVLTKTVRGTTGVEAAAREYEVKFSVTSAVTTNSSWLAGGDLEWLPPLPYKHDTSPEGGWRLGKLRSTERARLQISATHRAVRTLYFYGNGSGSPNIQHVFAQDDTSFDAIAKMPLTRWLTVVGGSEVRSTTLPPVSGPNAVSLLPAISTPVIEAQPLFLHNSAGASTQFSHRVGKTFQELPEQDNPHYQALLLYDFTNNFAFHWQQPTDGSPFAFRQFVYDGDQTIVLHEILRNLFRADRHQLIGYICQGNKKRDECDFGQFDVKTRLVMTQTSGINQVPFYLQTTLGGTDIDGRVTLRGYENYRFRAPDLALVQFEYGIPVYDPIGMFLFYDAGTVGNSISDLWVTRFRQDAGPGVFVRLRGHMVAQTYYAFGAGNGGRWGYNFAKVF